MRNEICAMCNSRQQIYVTCRALKRETVSLACKPVVSPDGKQIACIYRAQESDKWKVAVLSAEGGTPQAAFALPYPYNQVIRWTPVGKALTYLNRSEGVYNIWRQQLIAARRRAR